MKLLKNANGLTLRLSSAELKSVVTAAGWNDMFEDDDDSYGNEFTDVDLGDMDVDDILSEIDDEEIQQSLSDITVDNDSDYSAKCQEAMSILSPVMKKLTTDKWVDKESVINDLVDAVAPLVDDINAEGPLEMIREFVNSPASPEDESLKEGIRQIMDMSDISTLIEDDVMNENKTSRVASSLLGFSQSSDCWYKILGGKK